ncbi:MAG: hypothetical protein ACREAB_07235 [Blastocatellia bacterium]
MGRIFKKGNQVIDAMHDPGPWVDGKTSDVIVAPDADRRAMSEDAFDYYGGFVIAESVAPWNRPILKAAPELFDALAELEAEICARFTSNHEKAPGFMTENLRSKVLAARAALAKAKGETK